MQQINPQNPNRFRRTSMLLCQRYRVSTKSAVLSLHRVRYYYYK